MSVAITQSVTFGRPGLLQELTRMPLLVEIRKNATLARPLIALHAGQQLMSLVDTLMLERVSTLALAGAGIGSGLFLAVSVLGIGVLLGLDPLIAQAVGAGETARARAYARRGFALALWLSGPLAVLLALLPFGLPLVGVPAETAAETARFVWARIIGLPFLLLCVSCRSYLQAVGVTRPIVLGALASGLCNLPLNLLLVFGTTAGLPGLGRGGLPALGNVGAGLASSVATALGFAVIYRAWCRSRPVRGPAGKESDATGLVSTRAVLRLGGPMALQLVAEVCVYALGAVFIGRLGPVASAGHAVAAAVAGFTFSVALGIGAAASVRVGQEIGRADHLGARRAGLAGLVNVWFVMSAATITFYRFPEYVASLFATQPETIAAAVPLLQVAALFQLSDGTQAVVVAALRGTGDTSFGLRANLLGQYVIGLPVAIGLGFFSPLGSVGVWTGLSVGFLFATVSLLQRFFFLTASPIARVDPGL